MQAYTPHPCSYYSLAVAAVMSKITCPECKKRIALATSGCPICGFHIEGWWRRVGQRKHLAWRQRMRRRWALATSALLMVTLTALAKPVSALHTLVDDSLLAADIMLDESLNDQSDAL